MNIVHAKRIERLPIARKGDRAVLYLRKRASDLAAEHPDVSRIYSAIAKEIERNTR